MLFMRVFALMLPVLLLGCSTARPTRNERMGLIDRFSQLDHSRRSNRFSSIMRAPAGEIPGRKLPLGKGAVEVVASSFKWPLARVQVTSPYGSRGKDFHEGIDLRASAGTPVYASQDGTVIYAGSKIRGYGRMVVIRHFKEISTIYAHNSRLLVRNGQFVHQGQKIATSGNTGRSSGPHLHFEVRDGQAALNPLELLPRTQMASLEAPLTRPKAKKVAKRRQFAKR